MIRILNQIKELYPTCECSTCKEDGVKVYFNTREIPRGRNAEKCIREIKINLKLSNDPHGETTNSDCEFPICGDISFKNQTGFVDFLVIISTEDQNSSEILFLIEVKKTIKTSSKKWLENLERKYKNTIEVLIEDGLDINCLRIMCLLYYKKKKGYSKSTTEDLKKLRISCHGKLLSVQELNEPTPVCTLPIFSRKK